MAFDSAMSVLSDGTPAHERMKQLENSIGDALDKHGRELMALRDAHGEHSKILQGSNLTTTQRLDAIERVLAFTTDEKIKQTDEALKTTHTMYEQMRGRQVRQH